MAGARLQILDKNGKVMDEWITDGKVHEIVAKLDVDERYVLHEVSAPEGYRVAKDISFTVKANGNQLAMIDLRINTPTAVTNISLVIYKVDQDENFLRGATFRLVKVVDDNENLIGTQSGGPRYEFNDLDDGVYRVYEDVSPTGYEGLDGYFEFEIIEGHIYYDGELTNSFTVYNTNDGTEPSVLGDEIEEDDFDTWVQGEETKNKVKTSDDQEMIGYVVASMLSLLGVYLLNRKKKLLK